MNTLCLNDTTRTHEYYMYIRLNLHLHTSRLFRSAQRRALCDNELLHFHDRWKMCCTPCSAPLVSVSSPLCPVCPTIYPSAPWLPRLSIVSNDDGRVNKRRSSSELRQWKNMPHLLHQYCSLTWWKLTPANIFHHVIGRKDQMPSPDMPTLLPMQIMT